MKEPLNHLLFYSRLSTNYEVCPVSLPLKKTDIYEHIKKHFKLDPDKKKVGAILKQLFPSLKNTTLRINGKIHGAYSNIARIMHPVEVQVTDDWKSLLEGSGFLIKMNSQDKTDCCYPTKYTFNGVQLYLELTIEHNSIKLCFNGKNVNMEKVMAIEQENILRNPQERPSFLSTLKDLRPCTGYFLSKSPVHNVWGILGEDLEDGEETFNSQNCTVFLQLNTRSTTTCCESCQESKRYFSQKYKQAEKEQLAKDLQCTVTKNEHENLLKVMEEIKEFSCLSEEQKTFIISQLDRCRKKDARAYRWDRRYCLFYVITYLFLLYNISYEKQEV